MEQFTSIFTGGWKCNLCGESSYDDASDHVCLKRNMENKKEQTYIYGEIGKPKIGKIEETNKKDWKNKFAGMSFNKGGDEVIYLGDAIRTADELLEEKEKEVKDEIISWAEKYIMDSEDLDNLINHLKS